MALQHTSLRDELSSPRDDQGNGHTLEKSALLGRGLPFHDPFALGLISAGGRIGSSAAITRADAAAAAASRRSACCCCSRVGGRPGSGPLGSIGVLSVRRTTASRSGSSGYSLAAHQRSAKRLPYRMLTTGAFLACHIFRAFKCRR